MKVLQINSVCGVRSTGRICVDIAEGIKDFGVQSKIAYGRENVPEEYAENAVRIGGSLSTYSHALCSRIFDSSGWGSKSATKKFLAFMERYDADIIHLHNIHGYYINVEKLFEKLKVLNKPVVWTLHDCWAFTGHCACYDMIGCEKWKTGCRSCPQKTDYPASYVFDCSKSNYERKKKAFCGVKNMTLVTPSQWLCDEVKKSFLSCYPIKVIANGIDTDVFRPTEGELFSELKADGKKIVLGVASVWTEKKGFGDFFKLRELLPSEYEILLVGVTDKQIKTLKSGMKGIRRTDSTAELAQIYSAADVFVNFTYEDNYPTVNLEAQCCGLPVITYKTGGSVESVPDCQAAAKGDVRAVADMILAGGLTVKKNESADKKLMPKAYYDLYRAISANSGEMGK